MSPPAAPRRDLHAEITDQLIAALEQSPGSFEMPWRREGGALHLPQNALTGNLYSGINVLVLWCAAARSDFVSPIWATFKQWSELGAQVRKGEKASSIIFYKEYDRDPDPNDAADNGRRRVARASWVFNANQVDGFIAPEPAPAPLSAEPVQHLEAIQRFITLTGADIREGGDQAYYDRKTDHIQMPDRDRFIGTSTSSPTEAFHAILLHELVHWTGASSRLNRTFGERFGDQAYAAEELVAEIGSAFLCAELQLTPALRPAHAHYLASWLKLLKSDKKAIFVAAARASEATRYLHRGSDADSDRAGQTSPEQVPA